MDLKEIHKAEENTRREDYIHRALVALDIFVNVVTGGNEDETISSRVRRISDAHKGWSWNPGVWISKALNAALNLIQPNHGIHAEAGDLERSARVEAIESHALYYCDGADRSCPGGQECKGHRIVRSTYSALSKEGTKNLKGR